MSNLTKSIPADERKMLRKAFWRSFTLYAAVSPAKQGASGFCYSLMPFLTSKELLHKSLLDCLLLLYLFG